jgi:hypothetical protein
MNLQTINASASPETQMNENFAVLDWATCYAKNPTSTSALLWAYFGGRWGGFLITGATLTLIDASINYVVVAIATGICSTSITNTNWNNTAAYCRVYKLTTLGGLVTVTEDHRCGPYGVLSGPPGTNGTNGSNGTNGTNGTNGSNGVSMSLAFTSDTTVITDTDPGNGLFHWNNATQASATFIYFDNLTQDGVTINPLWAQLGPSGTLLLVQSDNAANWQLWNWTTIPVNGTGYYKFAVSLIAMSVNPIVTAKVTYAVFTNGGAQLNAIQTYSKAQRGLPVALTSTAASIAIDLATANNFTHTTTESTTLAAPSNPTAGQSGMIVITQGATPYTLSYNAFWKTPGATPPSLTASAGAVDLLAYYIESATRGTYTLLKGSA